MSPDQINEQAGKPIYHCRPCGAEKGLHWYRGTSCPVCSNPICTDKLNVEWAQAYYDMENEE